MSKSSTFVIPCTCTRRERIDIFGRSRRGPVEEAIAMMKNDLGPVVKKCGEVRGSPSPHGPQPTIELVHQVV